MSWRLSIRSDARADIVEAAGWYEAQGAGLGAAFLRSIDATLALIERRPLAFPVVVATARRALLRRFPYMLLFTVEGEEILIVGCIHGRRDPKRWQGRV